MTEKFLKPKYPAENKRTAEKKVNKNEEINLSRRKFLGQLTATVIASGTFSWGFSSWLKNFLLRKSQKEKFIDEKKEQDVSESNINIDFEEKIPKNKSENNLDENGEIKDKDFENSEIEDGILSLKEIIVFESKEPIVLNEELMEKLKKYWENVYENKMKKSLDKAWQRMGFWEDKARESFFSSAKKCCQEASFLKTEEEKQALLKEVEDFFYLAIPESHWNIWSDSGSAKGPFQFTSKTGKDFGLKQGINYDERTDPEKSASAAAKYLFYLYKEMNFDWKLAFSAYNGGFVWDYRKNRTRQGKKVSYADYLVYLSENIELIKKEALFSGKLTHEIKKGENWEKIAKKYGCEESDLKKINQKVLKKGLVEDQIVFLPVNDKIRKRYFYEKISGFSENIDYPAKFLAVLAVLEKRKKQGALPRKEKPPVFVTKKRIKQPVGYKKIQMQKGDNIAKIAFQYNISIGELKKINRIKKENFLPKQLLIPEKKITLASLADGNKGFLEVLHKLNPVIQNVEEPIPDGVEIKLLTLNDFLIAKKE